MSKILLNKNAFFHNLQLTSGRVGAGKVAIVLKDNAYGHGLLQMAELSREFGIKRAIVRNIHEAMQIKPFFESILMLSELEFEPFPDGIEPVANSLLDIQKMHSGAVFHLKVDTGMHRAGIDANELQEALKLTKQKNLKLTGVLSHLRSADELSSEYFWQTQNFLEVKKEVLSFCDKHGFDRPLFHLHNSAGVFRNSDFCEFDFVRVGIAAYGYLELPASFEKQNLKPVMSLWGQKIASRELAKGARVGYGGMCELQRDNAVSVYDIGYGDGFMRLNESHDYRLPNGSKLLGRVSMDSIIVEGSDDEVCLFDNANVLSNLVGTISYDVVTKLNPNIKRIVV